MAIVTGSSRGIGRAIAQRLAQKGAHVVVTYHSSKDKAQEIVDKIKANGLKAIAHFDSIILKKADFSLSF